MAYKLPSKYTVEFQKPIPELNTLAGDAYAVTGDSPRGRTLYAIVHAKAFPGRMDIITTQRRNPMMNICNAVDRGIVEVDRGDGTNVEAMATLIERPIGVPLASGNKCRRLNEKELKDQFLKPMLVLLANLHGRDLTHRAISPYWIFANEGEEQDVVVGECCSAPAAADQPDIFEPLERIGVPFYARGDAEASADVYSLGVTAYCLFYGEVPDLGEDDEHIYKERVLRGSHWLISQGKNAPTNMATFFKGVLTDDPEERWTLSDIAQWLDGSTSIKRVRTLNTAFSRPVKYRGKTYADRRILAREFGKEPMKAAEYLRSSDFHLWVSQFLAAEPFSERMASLLNVQKSDTPVDERVDQNMVARVCAFLDPYGPIYYNGLCLSYDGIGNFVAAAFQEGDTASLSILLELLNAGLFDLLIDIVGVSNPSAHHVSSIYSRAITMVSTNKVGQGLERFLYETVPGVPCMSPHFTRLWVDDLPSAVVAFENIMKDQNKSKSLFDRHVAAFLSIKMDLFHKLFMNHTGIAMPTGQAGANFIEVFAALQLEYRLGPMPNLAAAFANSLKPLIRSLRLASRRDTLAGKLMDIVESGDLGRLLTDLQVGQVKKLDDREFAAARATYKAYDREKTILSKGVTAADPRAMLEGYRWISYVAFIILGLASFAVFQ